MSATTEAVTALLAKYNEALNASSTDAVMPLYAEDGVFMPPYSQSAVGVRGCQKGLRCGVQGDHAERQVHDRRDRRAWSGLGLSRARIPRAQRRTMQQERRAQRATRSCSSSRRIMMAAGKSRGIVSHPPIRRSISHGADSGSRGSRELFQHRIGRYTSRVVLLPSDEVAVNERMCRPGRLCNITRARNTQAIFQEP